MMLSCPKCLQALRVPDSDNTQRVMCPSCKFVFYADKEIKRPINEIPLAQSHNQDGPKENMNLWLLIIALVFAGSLLYFLTAVLSKETGSNKPLKSNWITINYGDYIDKSILTHSGSTIGEVLASASEKSSLLKSLLQEYLEPYSVLCPQYLASISENESMSLTNMVSHYPIGSEQPAWVALFREGHFQLFYNQNLIRIFIQGVDQKQSFEKYRSVIRHPIRDLINSDRFKINDIEIYVFSNDYLKTEISFNTTPLRLSIDDINLSPKRQPLCLEGLEAFFDVGILLEAAETDNNKFYLYGKMSSDQTLTDHKVSLSDLAVAYRAVFHHFHNAPYISLDAHEDNRYAKVNFGGHLQNTRIGHVVLEADKLFKTLSTGINPNTHINVKNELMANINGFYIEDDRGLSSIVQLESSNIRYWFYPDEISTVTNGRIGVVQNPKFTAATERMDVKFTTDLASRQTIKHLNDNFLQYARAEKIYSELITVGRLMALMNWAKDMNLDKKVELEDLLSVMLPPITTPQKTKKILAVTGLAYQVGYPLTLDYAGKNSKTYNLSNLLDRQSPNMTDNELMKVAEKYFSIMEAKELYPSRINRLQENIEYHTGVVESNTNRIKSLSNEIEIKQRYLDATNHYAVDQFNNLVNRHNNLIGENESLIWRLNEMIDENNKWQTQSITSIGGGISLASNEFKRAIRDDNSPLINEIVTVKKSLQPMGKIYHSGAWRRSSYNTSGAKINCITISQN